VAKRPVSKSASRRKPIPRTRNKSSVLNSGRSRRGFQFLLLHRVVPFLAIAVFTFYGFVIFSLFTLRWIDPLTTSVQIQRRVESWFSSGHYRKEYDYVPLSRISPNLQHAVLSAEDARFFQHNGFDWKEIEQAVNNDVEGKRLRGASTITQQLVKNLYLTTSRSLIRKGVEVTIVPLMEGILSKQRILELYLNVIEWGPGVYGAEAAARFHYRKSAAALSRDEAARLAAIIPAPRHREPAQMSQSAARIGLRMREAGW
jgi:monofunctional glycosyltransferase